MTKEGRTLTLADPDSPPSPLVGVMSFKACLWGNVSVRRGRTESVMISPDEMKEVVTFMHLSRPWHQMRGVCALIYTGCSCVALWICVCMCRFVFKEPLMVVFCDAHSVWIRVVMVSHGIWFNGYLTDHWIFQTTFPSITVYTFV